MEDQGAAGQPTGRFVKLPAGVKGAYQPSALFEAGLTLDDVKQEIISILKPFFRHQELLEEFAVQVLFPEVVALVKLSEHRWAYEACRICLGIYHRAYSRSYVDSARCLASCERDAQEGLSHYWSNFQLLPGLDELGIEEFATECFRTIGMVAEACILPHLKDLAGQVKIAERGFHPESDSSQGAYGQIVTELYRNADLRELLAPPPWGIRLNQWRNIAQHHSYQVEEGIVVCKYGKKPGERELRLTCQELEKAAQAVVATFQAVKSARTFFFVDNIHTVKPFLPQDVPSLRPEQEVLNVAAAVATQGFELINIELTEIRAAAVLQDMTTQNPDQRRLHASQFLHALWNETERQTVSIEYRERDGTPNYSFEVLGEDCDGLSRGEIDLEEYVGRIHFTNLKAL